MRIVPIEFHLFWDLIRTSHKNSLLATLKGVANLGNIPSYPSMGLPKKKKNLSSNLMQPDLNKKKKFYKFTLFCLKVIRKRVQP